jgi:hypothetical protein
MCRGTEEPQSLVEVGSAPTRPTTEVNASTEQVADHASGRHDTEILRGNVVLEPGALVDTQLASLVNGCSQAAVVVAGIKVVGVVLESQSL